MLFETSLTIPANTQKENPSRVLLPVSEGTVEKVWVRWRWGSANLCGVRMGYNSFQYWPLTLGGWYPSNVESLEFAESKTLVNDPFEITVEGYNLDDTYEHTVWVAFLILRRAMSGNMQQFLKDLGELA
jgi:hypothetical protein